MSEQSSPGMFWCDLANGGREYLPLTMRETLELGANPEITEFAEMVLNQIPMFRGAVEAGHVELLSQAMLNASHLVLPLLEEKSSSEVAQQAKLANQVSLPGFHVAADYYQQFLQFQTTERLGGLKTPFLLIFKREFLEDFKQSILPLIPSSAYKEITWENILIRGMKADKLVWMHSGKPADMTKEQWSDVWEQVQVLKDKYHIDPTNEAQNAARGVRFQWQNFDDPYSLFLFANKNYGERAQHLVRTNQLTVVSDSNISKNPPQIQSQIKGSVVLLNSRITGQIQIKRKKDVPLKRTEKTESLFYNVDLPENQILRVPSNHLVVGIGDKIYSVKMGLLTKEELKKEMVMVYDFKSSEKEKNRILTPSPYMTYEMFAKNMK